MAEWLVRFALRNRFLVIAFWVLLSGVGVYSMTVLTVDAVPDITNVQVLVLTSSPALGPVDIERQVTIPIETALSGLPGLAELRSVSRYGISAVTVVFDDRVDLYFARQLVSERLTQAR